MVRSFTSRVAPPLLLTLAAVSPAFAQDDPPMPRVFAQAANVDTAAALATAAVAGHVGLRVELTAVAGTDARADLPPRGIPVWLSIDTPSSQDSVDVWRRNVHALLERIRPAVLELRLADQTAQLSNYLTQVAATDAGVNGSVKLALGGNVRLEEIYTRALAPYVDALVIRSDEERDRAIPHLAEVDPDSTILIAPADASPDIARAVIDHVAGTVGTVVGGRAWRVGPGEVLSVIRAVESVRKLLGADISELDPKASQLRLTIAGQDVAGRVRHRLLFDNKSLATFLVYWGEGQRDRLRFELILPSPGVPVVHDLLAGTRARASGYERRAETSATRAEARVTGGPMMVDFNEEATEVFADRTGVSAPRQLTADEIIARHRQQQARQDAAVQNYIARVRLQQHFRPTVTDPGYDVVTVNRYFVDREGVEWEELSFAVNGSKWGADRPPFPLLQPEKVLSLPLQLRFDEDYRYELQGTDTTDGYGCYLIRFEPLRNERSLYRGTLWIDTKTFARVRVRAVQTRLDGPVVSNEEVQVYRPVPVPGGSEAFLLRSLTAHQIVLIAGRNILLEKVATFESFDVNVLEFGDIRQLARMSDRVMYRETDRGLRHFVKRGKERVVADQETTSAKAMAVGVTIDPSYAFPLPMFGINYLDFEFRDPQTQLAILFAGVLAAGNIQRPHLGDTPFDASIDFFAIAVPSNDRLYTVDAERREERLLTWPLTTGVNLGWQFTPFQKLGVQYQFRFDGFSRDRDTAESFIPPPSTTTHGVGLLWEYRRAGYSLVLNGLWNRRLGWREWGHSESPEISEAAYAKYSASISRDFVSSPFQKIHVDGAWFGGKDLDRLSRYQFGLFEATRIHGVPSSGLRFDDLLLLRGAYSFNIFDQYRLDMFLDRAWGRDRSFAGKRQPITGIGAAINVRAPWGTILRADFGKSFLPERYRGVGSTVLQVMLLKPIR